MTDKRRANVLKTWEWCSEGSTEKQAPLGLLQLTQSGQSLDTIPNFRREGMYLGGFESKNPVPGSEELIKSLNKVVKGKRLGDAEQIGTQEEFFDDLDAKLRELEDSESVADAPTTEDEEVLSGRMGATVVSLSKSRMTGEANLTGKDGLTMESTSNFCSILTDTCVFAGKWMYEITLETAGIQQIGWAILNCHFTGDQGVGDDLHSYAYDGKRKQKWNKSSYPYGESWQPGDVIGTTIDLDKGEISFIRNGQSMGVAFSNVEVRIRLCHRQKESRHGLGLIRKEKVCPRQGFRNGNAYFPAVSLSQGERSTLNFGSRPFYYPQPGFKPVQDPPPTSLLKQSGLLINCLCQLVDHLQEVKESNEKQESEMSEGLHYFSTKLGMEIVKRFVGYAVVSKHREYLFGAEVIPTFFEYCIDSASQAVYFMQLVCDESAFQLIISEIFSICTKGARCVGSDVRRLSSVRTEKKEKDTIQAPFEMEAKHIILLESLLSLPGMKTNKPSAEEPSQRQNPGHGTESKSDGKECVENTGNGSILAWWIRQETFSSQLEDILFTRRLSLSDLANAIPSVCLPGCSTKDELDMEESLYRLRRLYNNHEKCQIAICKILLAKAESKFTRFLIDILKKNKAANRNVKPPGLSDSSVLACLYFALLDHLWPTFVGGKSAAFNAGILVGNLEKEFDFPRIGGTLNYVGKNSSHTAMQLASRRNKIDLPPYSGTLNDMGQLNKCVDPNHRHRGGWLIGQESNWSESSCSIDTHDTVEWEFEAEFCTIPQSLKGSDIPTLQQRQIHSLILLFHLGMASRFKIWGVYLQTQRSVLLHLQSLENSPSGSNDVKNMLRKELIDMSRQVEESKMIIYEEWKQQAIFDFIGFMARMLLKLSEENGVWSYVPELYIETVLDMFHALGKLHGDRVPLGRFGSIDHLISFQVKHLSDPRIINPDVRDLILQSVGALLKSSDMLAAFENCDTAREYLIPAVMESFDHRFWIPTTNILAKLISDYGFAQLQGFGSSSVFQEKFSEVLNGTSAYSSDITQGFMDRLNNTVNWTASEFVQALKDVGSQRIDRRSTMVLERGHGEKCNLMFEFTVALLRLLEFVAQKASIASLTATQLILRTSEVLVFLLKHITSTAEPQVFEKAVQSKSSSIKSLNRSTLLAPIIGILEALASNEERRSPLVESLCRVGPKSCAKMIKYLEEYNWPDDNTPLPDVAAVELNMGVRVPMAINVLKARNSSREMLKEISKLVEAQIQSEAEQNDVPDDFLDPIEYEIMRDPVKLPQSGMICDRRTIERHLHGDKTDPFSRSPLSVEDLIPQPDLKAQIEEWLQQKR